MRCLIACAVMLLGTVGCQSDSDRQSPARPLSAREYVSKAEDVWKRGKYDEALSYLDKSLEIDNSDAGAYNFRGVIHLYFKEDHDAARADFTRAIELAPECIFPYTCRGWIHFLSEDYDAALHDFQTHVDLAPTAGFAYFKLGVLHYYQGQYSKAAAYFAQGIQKAPKFELNILWKYFADAELGRASKDTLLPLVDRNAGDRFSVGILMLLGEKTVQDYLNSRPMIQDSPKVWADRHVQAEGRFLLGKKFLLEGKTQQARAYFELVVRDGSRAMALAEILAKKELARMK